MALPAEKERFTFADVLTWDENERIEIIDGAAPENQQGDFQTARKLS